MGHARVKDGRWVTIAESQFPHEKQGLAYIKQLLPDTPPFRAWANFEFRDNRGRWHEVDLLVLARDTLYLIELKHYNGTLRGNDHIWLRNGYPAEDSPLLLTRRKAQYFATLLKDTLRQATGENPRGVVPFVQELVFLHHPRLKCELPTSSKINLYGLDDVTTTTHLDGIATRLLRPAQHAPVSEERGLLLAELMKKVGLVPRRKRGVGSWIIDEQPLADGDGWQDWPAFHNVDAERHARIRFYTIGQGATSAEINARKQAVTHEFNLLSRLRHDGLQIPADLVNEAELGIGLVFPQPKGDTPLDLWLADRKALPLQDQLTLIADLAGILQYAHRNRVVHRGLNPRSVAIRERHGKLLPQITDWDSAGVLPANPDSAVSRLSTGPLTLMAATPSEAARLFAAPEGPRPKDPARIDVFGLGALAFFILTGGRSPAIECGELMDRLRRDHGLDLAAELPQVRTKLRQLVLDATNPSPAERIADMATFLERLADASEEALGTSTESDPLEAGPGAELANGRFVYKRKLGEGSTAVGILVADRKLGSIERVIKVAKNFEADERLQAESDVLARLQNERSIVTLHDKLPVGGRTALVLSFAGRTTLADELNGRRRLSIDVLRRWGADLLKALTVLERNGVTHRDIKPANLAVSQTNQRSDSHLVLFDFSMAAVDAKDVTAGTRPYLDPFLGTGERRRFDTAAERYGAAVVLFEMATGKRPHYGTGDTHPATIDADVTLEPHLFESEIAADMTAFFASALSRDAARRHDTAEDMLSAWKRIFDNLTAETPPADRDAAADRAEITTALSAAGLTPRAVSALAGAQVATVGELLALDSTLLNRVVGREARDVRTEIRTRSAAWKSRLGQQDKRSGDAALMSLDSAVGQLMAAVSGRATTRREAAALLLNATPGLEDGFASSTELAAKLGRAPQRGLQLLKELQRDWAEHEPTRTLLDAVTEVARQVIADFGGVAAVKTLTAEIRARLPEDGMTGKDPVAQERVERTAAGLLRVAIDRLSEHETASGAAEFVRRRHGRRLALLATDECLLAAAEAAGSRADELVSGNRDSTIQGPRAARQLETAFTAGYRAASDTDATVTPPSDQRLLRLAAAISKHAAVSGRGELYNRDIAPSVAAALALSGLAQTESLTAAQVRSRIAARFPELARVPQRPQLDVVVAQTGLGLVWDDKQDRYHFPDQRPASSTTMHTHIPTAVPATADPTPTAAGRGGDHAAALRRSIQERGFLAIGVPIPKDRPGEHERVARRLSDTYDGQVQDFTADLIAAMRDLAQRQGVSWDLIRGADAAEAGSRDAQGLRTVVDRVMPSMWETLRHSIFDGEASVRPLILTEVSPLARYGYLDVLAKLSDLAAPRRRPVWLVLPQLRGQHGAMVDRKPIQLGAPSGQFLVWRPHVRAGAESTGVG